MKNYLKALIGRNVNGFIVHDVDFDETSSKFTIVFESKPESYKPDELVGIHSLTFDDKYCIDYLVDEKKFDYAYERFCEALHDYACRNYMLNNFGGFFGPNEMEVVIFRNILDFLQSSDAEKVNKYGTSIIFSPLTSLWLGSLRTLNVQVDTNEINQQLAPKIDEMMKRYLAENPKYIDKVERIYNSLTDFMKGKNLKSDDKLELQPQKQ